MWSNYSQEFGASTALDMTLSGEHPCQMCLSIQKQRTSAEDSPTKPFPTQKQLRLDPFDCSPVLTPQSRSSRPQRNSPPGRIALLGPQTIILDVVPPPPDCFFS